MRSSHIIDRSQHQIDEQAVGEENDEQEMLAMKMKAVGINPDLHMGRRPFSMRGSLNMIIRKNEQKNIIEGNRVSTVWDQTSNFLFCNLIEGQETKAMY